MPQKLVIPRRQFLKTTAAGAAVLSTGVWSQLPAADSKSPNQKLNIACVGTANRAGDDVNGVKGENIVALVDVDQNYLDRAKKTFPEARAYNDYREMLDKEKGKIDACVIGTADHQHAPAAIRAIRNGLHVYVEKPLTHTVTEARILAEAAKKHGVVTQMGTQIHAEDNYRRVVEMIQSGVIGDVQGNRKNHGRPWQAICLYSSDLLADLRSEGHPVEAGGTGENLTMSGIDWSRMRGGLTVTIASAGVNSGAGASGGVVLRTSGPAAPCHKIGDCFSERHWNRIDHTERPGWARWYASVLAGGTIAPGDTITITA